MSAAAQQNSAYQRYFPVDDRRGEVVPFTSATSRVRITAASPWSKALESRLNAITSLPKGWNGYRSVPVSFTCAAFAAQLIERLYDASVPPPALVPGADGTLQIEWHRNQYDIEVDILEPYKVFASRYDCVSGDFTEIALSDDFTVLAEWLKDMKSARADLATAGAAVV